MVGTISLLRARGSGEGERCDVNDCGHDDIGKTIEGIFQLMINHRISGVPVVAGDGWRIGMVTKNDLSRRVEIGVRDLEGHTMVGPLFSVL